MVYDPKMFFEINNCQTAKGKLNGTYLISVPDNDKQ